MRYLTLISFPLLFFLPVCAAENPSDALADALMNFVNTVEKTSKDLDKVNSAAEAAAALNGLADGMDRNRAVWDKLGSAGYHAPQTSKMKKALELESQMGQTSALYQACENVCEKYKTSPTVIKARERLWKSLDQMNKSIDRAIHNAPQKTAS